MNTELRSAILEYVNANDHVTFAELHRRFESRFNLRGDYAFAPGSFPTLILWAGMSEEYCTALQDLTSPDGPLVKVPCAPFVYMIDGQVLNMPVAKRAHTYKEDHWLPIVLRPRAKYEADERKAGGR